jgi:hypothetical protein
MFYKNIKNHAQEFLNKYKKDNPTSFAAAQQAIGGLLILDGFVGIDNPLAGKKRSGIFGSLFGIAFGLFFIFGAGLISNFSGINKLTAVTSATVVGVSQPTYTDSSSNDGSRSSSCTVQAKYTVNGKEYSQTSTSGSSSACSLTRGQSISINYDPNSPGAFAYDLNSLKTVLKIFPIAGAIVVVLSSINFVIRLLSIIFGWKLLKSGRALAKTLPAGTDLSTLINEIKQNFAKSIFGVEVNSEIPTQIPKTPKPPSKK